MKEAQPTGEVVSGVPAPLRILFWDVETSPLLAYIWNATPNFVPHTQIIHDSFMLCWAAKWADERQPKAGKLTREEVLARDDARLVGELADLIREADIVVAHNGDRFDLPVLRGRLLANGLEPLPPVDTIDTLKLAKKSFRFSHNKLDNLAQRLGLGAKLPTDFALWESVYHGDEVAMQRMVKYCKNDVVLLQQLFDKLAPHATGLRRLFDGEGSFCPYCGSRKFQRRGYRRTNAGTSVRYQCKDCLRYFKDKTTDAASRQMRPI